MRFEHARVNVASDMTTLDRDFWENRWTQVLREHPEKVSRHPPNAHLVAALADLAPGLALDAGCGHGSETLWLAARGWRVEALDFSATALAYAESTAEAAGLADRIEWAEADLTVWAPEPGRYGLVVSLYVHIAGSVQETVRRLASGVAPGGTLFLVGHRPIDPATGAETAAADQVQVSVDEVLAALDRADWETIVAEDRPRAVAGTGVDAVIRLRRRAAQTRSTV
jgi:2-polyprenyl-3-methyl-5-hydroxy-6-metoxy-1,4-benzoquinol methylase